MMDIGDALDGDRVDAFWRFVAERHAVWYRSMVARMEPPWTDDPVLQDYYFTNVYRELDPGTQYAIQEILDRDAPRRDRLFNVLLYRLIGRQETHQHLGFQAVDAFDPDAFTAALEDRRKEAPVFTGAYMVSGYSQMGSEDKVENVARLFADIADRFNETMATVDAADSAQEAFTVLRDLPGFGDFLAYQTVVDLLYPLSDGDAFLPVTGTDWAKAGPGAKQGIDLLREDDAASYLQVMRWLRERQDAAFDRRDLDFRPILDRDGNPLPLSMANVQNCLCEYHKYRKIQDNPRRARRTFTPGEAELDELRAMYAAAPNLQLPDA